MLARLASAITSAQHASATATTEFRSDSAASTPPLRSFCTEPSLKPHVHASASKAAPTLIDASDPFALPARLHRADDAWRTHT
eukprot:2812552-Prymnesium_polylepis.1